MTLEELLRPERSLCCKKERLFCAVMDLKRNYLNDLELSGKKAAA
jgi:hypothetical protein